jgi:hypothetical protein
LIATFRSSTVVNGVEKFSLSQSPKANCHMLNLNFWSHHIRSTSNPPSTEFVVKIFSNWERITCWWAILLQDSCCLETCLTQLWKKPRLKHLQISCVIDTCIEKIWLYNTNN